VYQDTAPSSPQTGDVWVDSDAVAGVLNQNDYLLKADAEAPSGYLLKTDAASTYETQADAALTYATKADFPEGAWITYAPTMGGTGWSQGDGVYSAFYCQIGKTVHVQLNFTLGSSTTKGSTAATFTLPVTAARAVFQPVLARYVLGATGYLGFGAVSATDRISMYVPNASGTYTTQASVTASQPATWATNDSMQIAFTYEAA
jgi:hypothetical protein